MIAVPRVVLEATADARQCGLDLAAEMGRMGVSRFRDLHGWCDANDVLLDVTRRRGFCANDLLAEDCRLANQVISIADWIWGETMRRERNDG